MSAMSRTHCSLASPAAVCAVSYRRAFALTHLQPVVVRRFELRPNGSGRRRAGMTATGIAFVIGSVLGAALAVFHFPGRVPVLIIVNALLGLPPVVAGLFVFLLV